MRIVIAFLKRSTALTSLPLCLAFLAWSHSPETRDQFVNIFALACLVAMLGRFGSDALLYKKSSCDPDPKHFSWCESLALRISLALTVLLSVAWASAFRPAGYSTNDVTTVGLSAIALVALQHASTLLQIRGWTLMSSLIFPAPLLVFATCGVLLGVGVSWALSFASLLVIGICIASKLCIRPRLPCGSDHSVSQFKEVLPYAALSINKAFFGWGVSVYIAYMLGPASLTVFVIGNRLAALLSMPANSLNPYFLSEFSSESCERMKEQNHQLTVNAIRLSLAVQFVILAVYLFSFPYIAAFFKVDVYDLLLVVTPLCLAQVFHGMTGPVGSLLLMSGYERSVASVSLSVAVGTLLMGFLASWSFGLLGLGVAHGGMLVLQNILYVAILWRRDRRIPFFDIFRRRLNHSRVRGMTQYSEAVAGDSR